MGVLFEDDARRQLLAKLGFSEALSMGTSGGAPPGGGADAAGSAALKGSVSAAEQQLASAMEQLGVAGPDGAVRLGSSSSCGFLPPPHHTHLM